MGDQLDIDNGQMGMEVRADSSKQLNVKTPLIGPFPCGVVDEDTKIVYEKIFKRLRGRKRHIDEHHLKILRACECGKMMTQSALIRHKKESCEMNINRIDEKTETKQGKKRAHHEVDQPESVSDMSTQEVVNVESFQIVTNVQLLTMKNGEVLLTHDDIKVGPYMLTLKCVTPPIENVIEQPDVLTPPPSVGESEHFVGGVFFGTNQHCENDDILDDYLE